MGTLGCGAVSGAGELKANSVIEMAGAKHIRTEGYVNAAAASWLAGTAETQRYLREAALRAAGKHFTADEYHQLEADISAGLVDIRVYDGGLVLMRQPS
jgi:hypothetical protein